MEKISKTIKTGLESLKNMAKDKKEYKEMLARIKALPDDYEFVYNKIQHYMWSQASGSGMDMIEILSGLLELFEQGVAEGKKVLEITGEDVGTFSDELLKNANTYTANWKENLNKDIAKKLSKK